MDRDRRHVSRGGRGLAAAHKLGLVHRDFKPSNVLIDRNGRPRIIDFGLVRAAASGSRGAASVAAGHADVLGRSLAEEADTIPVASSLDERDGLLTETGTVMGTPYYMSPEQFAAKPLEPSSDQFSFCIALYQALYGRQPFGGTNVPARKKAVMAGELLPPPAKTLVPLAIGAAVARGLAVEPGDRWAGMDELLDELASSLAKYEPAQHEPDIRQFLRRAFVLIALVIAAFGSTAMYLHYFAGSVQAVTPAVHAVLHTAGGGIFALAIYLTRNEWRQTQYLRRLVGMFAVIFGFAMVSQNIAYATDMRQEHMLLHQMIMHGAVLTLGALQIARWLWWMVAIQAAGVAVTVAWPELFVMAYFAVTLASLVVATALLRPHRLLSASDEPERPAGDETARERPAR